MFTEVSLHQHPELMAFIDARRTDELYVTSVYLKAKYCFRSEQNQEANIYDVTTKEAYTPLRIVAEMGLLDHVDFLLTCATYRFSSDDHALRGAVKEGHVAVVKRLFQEPMVYALVESNPTSFLLMAMIASNLDMINLMLENERVSREFYPLPCMTQALKGGDVAIIQRLLMFPNVLAIADHYEKQYANHTHTFINERLHALRLRQHEALDFQDPTELALCFYMLRNLIRRNSPELHADIKFLLSIPSLRAWVHEEVTPNESNELFRLAVTVHNYQAEDVLSLIPDVIKHAKQHDFYGDANARARHKHRCLLNLTCIFMLQAAYPAHRDEVADEHRSFCELLIPELLGRVFSYLSPRSQDDSAQEGMCFVHRAEERLLAQSSRLFYRPIAQRESESENPVLPHNV